MELSTYGIKKSREERRYSVPQGQHNGHTKNVQQMPPASEDLHAWSIYRQNLNSDFTDSALGSSDKSPLPYGNFQLRDTTVHSILNHPRYGPKSSLGSNMYTYLKFGLPRVFPPNESQRYHRTDRTEQASSTRGRINRAFRDSNTAGSSGYDSSDNENGTTRRNRQVPANLRKYRSESDFRTLGEISQVPRPNSTTYRNIPSGALKQPNSRASIAGTHVNNYQASNRYQHTRSHSEADLLANDTMTRNGSEIFYDYDPRVVNDARSKSEQYAIMSRRHSSMLLYPNIVVRGLDVSPDIRGVSFQAKAGDLFAIMATSKQEGTALIETLAGINERLRGDILINGQHVSKALLREICGFVPAPNVSSLDPRMSVQSTLSFHAALKGPVDRSDLKERIDILVEDLGLTAVRSANISRLTHSEKQRLNVALQLLTQSPILILDQATTNMDIFDTFFLVEYLRQWGDSGRIVIMTLQPPTFEILSMCSGVLLLSGGKTIFSGPRSELPKHMGSLGYPCPPFKNPADYYLDLVTLDDLSAAALLESSARIESLANAWDRLNSDIPLPPPVANLPEVSIKSGIMTQFKILCQRFIIYTQPGALLSWISKLILAAILSLFIGCIFWDIPNSDPQLTYNDRLGYHHCLMVVTIWPILLLFAKDIQNDRKFAEKDIRLGLYSRFTYITVQCILRIVPSLFIWLVYLLPAHSMAALYSYPSDNDNGIYIYIGFMLLYLITLQTLSAFITYSVTSNNILGTIITILSIMVLSSVSNYMVHPKNIQNYLFWLSYISPQKWILPLLTKDEYSEQATSGFGGLQLCRNKQVQHQEIIVQQQCPQPNGTAVQQDFHILPTDHILTDNPEDIFGSTIAALILASFCFFVLTIIVFIIQKSGKKVKKQN